jgi:signal peptide peptidase SppA
MVPETLQVILSIARRENESPAAVEARLGRPLDNAHRAEMRGSVAVIPVTGPLFRRANVFTDVSGATSYDMIAQDLRAALDNPAVKSILLNIDSPGGQVNGLAELALHVYEARQKKQVVAYVGGMGASAAYWLASAASEVVAAKTAHVGSVGVVVGVAKGSGDEIVSSQSPYKRIDPTTAEGKARIQAMVDNLAAIFIEDVAKYRGKSVEHVSANFGQGDVLLGAAAVEAGMADSLGTFEGLIESLNDTHRGESRMSAEKLRADHPGLIEKIEAEARADERAKCESESAAKVGAECARVLGIIEHPEATGREPLARKLARMGMTVEAAAELLSATPKAAATTATPVVQVMSTEFDKHMAKLNPAVKADVATADDEDAEMAAYVERMKNY